MLMINEKSKCIVWLMDSKVVIQRACLYIVIEFFKNFKQVTSTILNDLYEVFFDVSDKKKYTCLKNKKSSYGMERAKQFPYLFII